MPSREIACTIFLSSLWYDSTRYIEPRPTVYKASILPLGHGQDKNIALNNFDFMTNFLRYLRYDVASANSVSATTPTGNAWVPQGQAHSPPYDNLQTLVSDVFYFNRMVVCDFSCFSGESHLVIQKIRDS